MLSENLGQVLIMSKPLNQKYIKGKEMQQPSLALGFLEYLSDGVLILNHQHQIVAANSSAINLLMWDTHDLIGRLCEEILGCEHLTKGKQFCEKLCPNRTFLAAIEFAEDLKSYHCELTLKCKNEEQRIVHASFSPLRLNSFAAADSGSLGDEEDPAYYTIMIMRDITEQKRMERIKTQFLLTASHQLRTPLSSIKNSIGLLLDNVPSDLAKPLVRLLENIQNSSLRMERLVNDLIELADLQSDLVQLRTDWLDVRNLVEQAVEDNREKLLQKEQTLNLFLPTEPVAVRGDNLRLVQVLGHLLSNASKFSSNNSPITLRVEMADAPAKDANSTTQEVIFSVADKGRGISLEEQQLIFEKFYQSEISENADGSGMGLGLPLAKALVELHRGRLWLESFPGKGSTFYFALPAVH